MTSRHEIDPSEESEPTEFLATARGIADRLAAEAIRDGDRCTWLGFDVEEAQGEWRSVYRTIDAALYGGLPGIALILARVATLTGDARHAETAASALRESLRRLHADGDVETHGWYNGLSGALWALRQAASLLPDVPPVEDAVLLRAVRDAPAPADGAFDLIGGVSGTLAGLLVLGLPDRPGDWRAACEALGDWLLDRAADGPGIGLSWRETTPEASAAYPPCGLGHGASSVAVSLLALWSVTGRDRYREAAFEAFRYERQWFDRTRCGWPDLREVSDMDPADPAALPYPVYWCYGAAGIGLARLRAWQLTADPGALAEARAALFACERRAREVLARPVSAIADADANASLCHGLGSVQEVLLEAARLGQGSHLIALARRLGARLRPAPRDPWACGVVGGGEAPGLMLGLAGIGHIFLGLHAPREFSPLGLPPLPRRA